MRALGTGFLALWLWSCSSPGANAPAPVAQGSGGARASGGAAAGGAIGDGSSGGTNASGGAAGTGAGGNAGSSAPGDGGAPGDAASDVAGAEPDSAAPAGDAGPGAAMTIDAFRAAHVYFNGEKDNHRQVEADVDFPTAGPWKAISLHLRLSCPTGKCDVFDRWGYLAVVNGEGMAATYTEILRFVTAYGKGGDWTIDVSALGPLLAGKKKLAVKIDTWVAPGGPYGNGWLVDASFGFAPGKPTRVPVQVIPLWDISTVDVGDPAKPTSASIPARTASVPADASAVELRAFITGHGQGNVQNCAEFCPKNHGFSVEGMQFNTRIWRDDCATTAIRPQPGGAAPFAPRAGWCPGATVVPWIVDVTAAIKKGASSAITYSPEPYENACRPEAATCRGCVFNTGCAYDNGLHTAPSYLYSALLVVYKAAD
jgi:hypothetical protein